MDIIDVGNSIMSCVKELNFNAGGEKLFEVYQACSTVSTQGQITRYAKVPDLADCFFKQYTPLSKYVASTCIPDEFQTSYFKCMNNTQENFLKIMRNNYNSATLYFPPNTLGREFQKEIEMCSSLAIRQKAGELLKASQPIEVLEKLPTDFNSNTTLYIVTSIVVIAITAAILWRFSHRQREHAH